MSYVKGYSHCNRCGGFFKVETLGDAGACNNRAWCDGVVLHRAEILTEFAEMQRRAAGFAGIDSGTTGVPDGYQLVTETWRVAAEKKATRHAARAVDRCKECGKQIVYPSGRQRVRRTEFCFTAGGNRTSVCRAKWNVRNTPPPPRVKVPPCGVCGKEISLPPTHSGRPPRYCLGTKGARSACYKKAHALKQKARLQRQKTKGGTK